MRDLETQLRAWTDQAAPVTVDDVDAAVSSGRIGLDGPARRGRTAAWALIAAVVLVVAGLAFVVAGDDGDEAPASPGPQTTIEPSDDPSTTTSLLENAATGDPDLLVAFTADGRLISIDPVTGEERAELATGYSAADEPEVEGGPYVISSVTVDRDGGDLYFATCCEPAVGEIFRVRDTQVERYRNGDMPALSPDGTMLAVVELQTMKIIDVATGDAIREWALMANGPIGEGGSETSELVPSDISWSPDGSQLVMVTSDYTEGVSTIRVVEIDDTSSGAVFAARTVADGPIEGSERPTLPLFDSEMWVSFVRQNLNDEASDGTVVEVDVFDPLASRPYGADGDARSDDTLDAEILSRFWFDDSEWRLLTDGTVTVDGELRFTVPGLRLLAG